MTRPAPEFQIWRDKAGMWRWLLADSNGVTLCVGDAQGSWDACVKKIDRVRRLSPSASGPLWAAPCVQCRKMAVLSTETRRCAQCDSELRPDHARPVPVSPEEITAAARRECAEWGIGFDQFVAAGRGGWLTDGDQRDWWLIYGDLLILDHVDATGESH